jgi:hypothetical protein
MSEERAGAGMRPRHCIAYGVAAVAVIVVHLATGTRDARRISACTFTARDDKGRMWQASSRFADWRAGPGVSRGCYAAGPGARYLALGETARVATTFLVPEDAVSSLRAEVRMRSPGPAQYLRFAR